MFLSGELMHFSRLGCEILAPLTLFIHRIYVPCSRLRVLSEIILQFYHCREGELGETYVGASSEKTKYGSAVDGSICLYNGNYLEVSPKI